MNKEIKELRESLGALKNELNDKVLRSNLLNDIYEHRFSYIMRKIYPNVLEERWCPKCRLDQKMVLLNHKCAVGNRFRCMGCLTLWDEYEGEVHGKDKVS